MREYQAALSDSYRCIVLNPDGWKGYSRYSCALRALGEEVKAECIYHEVQTCLPHYKSTLTQEWSKFSEIFSKLSIKKEKEERKRAASPEESDPKAVEGAEKKGDKPKKKSKKQEMQQKKLTKKFEVINEHLKRVQPSTLSHHFLLQYHFLFPHHFLLLHHFLLSHRVPSAYVSTTLTPAQKSLRELFS
jgi:hypothetical protein